MHTYSVGHRVLSEAESDLIAKLSQAAGELKELLAHVELHIMEQHEQATATKNIAEMERLQDAEPFRWHKAAKHSFQEGIMFAIRAVAQPKSF